VRLKTATSLKELGIYHSIDMSFLSSPNRPNHLTIGSNSTYRTPSSLLFSTSGFLSLALSATAVYQWLQIRRLRDELNHVKINTDNTARTDYEISDNMTRWDSLLEIKGTTMSASSTSLSVDLTPIGHLTLKGHNVGLFATRLSKEENYAVRLSLCTVEKEDATDDFSMHVTAVNLADGSRILDIKPYPRVSDQCNDDNPVSNDTDIPCWLSICLKKRRNVRFASHAEYQLSELVQQGGLFFYKSDELAAVKLGIQEILSIDDHMYHPRNELCKQQIDNLLIYYYVATTKKIKDNHMTDGRKEVEVRLVKFFEREKSTSSSRTSSRSSKSSDWENLKERTPVKRSHSQHNVDGEDVVADQQQSHTPTKNIAPESQVHSFLEIMRQNPLQDVSDMDTTPSTGSHQRSPSPVRSKLQKPSPDLMPLVKTIFRNGDFQHEATSETTSSLPDFSGHGFSVTDDSSYHSYSSHDDEAPRTRHQKLKSSRDGSREQTTHFTSPRAGSREKNNKFNTRKGK